MAGSNKLVSLIGCVGILIVVTGVLLITYRISEYGQVDMTKEEQKPVVKIYGVDGSSYKLYNELTTQETVNGTSYQVPLTIRLRLPWEKYTVADDAKPTEIATVFKHSVSRIQAECMQRARIGTVNDGGWDVCLSGPYNLKAGCIVYDFGIANQWSFDDEISLKFGCRVRAFDPTTGLHEHNRSDLIHFYPVGLSGMNGKIKIDGKECPVKTLGTLIRDLGDANKTIDFLKMDIEGSEWSALPTAIKEGVLPHVKQIGLEIHGKSTTLAISILNDLYDLGFRKWHHHWNHHCLFSDQNGIFTLCNELYFINVNYLRTS